MPAAKVNLKGLEGWNKSVEGAEKAPKDNSCVDAGKSIVGAGVLEMTRVAVRRVDPVASVAVIPTGTPVTVSCPASLTDGVPDRVRALPSSESQPGPFDKV